jgi:tetratricopeptide (TPR) repeat protein
MIKYRLLVIVLFSVSLLSYGSAISEKDSLRHVLDQGQISDIQRAEVLLKYGKLIRSDSLPVSSKYLSEGLTIAKSISNDTLSVDFYQALGVTFGMQSIFAESIENFQNGLKLVTAIRDDERTATLLNGLGIVHKRLGDYTASQQYYYQAMEIYEKIGDQKGLITAIENLGVLYDLMGDYDQSRAYYHRVLDYYQQHGTSTDIAGVKSNLAILLMRETQYNRALHEFKEVKTMYESAGFAHRTVNILSNMGYLYNRTGQYDSALFVLKQALASAQEMNLKQEEVTICYNISDAYASMGQWTNALTYADRQLLLTRQLGSFSLLRDAEKMLSKVYEKMGNTSLALEHYKTSVQWADSVINEEKTRTFKTQEVKMEVLKKDVQLAEQKNTLQIQEEKIALERKWNVMLITSLGLLSLAAFMVYQRSLSRKRYAIMLESKNLLISEQKDKIEMAKLELEGRMLRSQLNPHFIFNSLSSIQHFITENDKSNALRYLSKFSNLLRKVLESSFNLNSVLEDEINLLKVYLELESLRFTDSFTYNIELKGDLDASYYEMPTLLLQPFIENALLHGLLPKEGHKKILISFQENEQMIHCVIEDNGIGREASRAMNNKKSRDGLPRGIAVSEQRLSLLARQYNLHAGVTYEDIFDEHGNAVGTRVHIDLPKIEAN